MRSVRAGQAQFVVLRLLIYWVRANLQPPCEAWTPRPLGVARNVIRTMCLLLAHHEMGPRRTGFAPHPTVQGFGFVFGVH